MAQKPQYNFWQIWNLCFGFIGIQFGFALQNANVSRIFQSLGAEIDDIPILWVAAPLTGLIVQPIVGYFSDKSKARLGRRRPYILTGAIVASCALIFMPNSTELWIAAGALWILDSSINMTLGPSIALIGDSLSKKQHVLGFSIQSFLICTTAVVASSLPWVLNNGFGVSNVAPPGSIPPSVKYAFYIGALVFVTAVGWTVFKSREYSREELETFQENENQAHNLKPVNSHKKFDFKNYGLLWLTLGLLVAIFITWLQLDKKLYLLAAGFTCFGLLLISSAYLKSKNREENGIYRVMQNLVSMPKVLRQLALVQLLTWFALFSMWIYCTSAVSSFHYGVTNDALQNPSVHESHALFNEAADWVGILFATYNGMAVFAAMLLPWMASRSKKKYVHSFNLTLGAIALSSFVWIKEPVWLLVPMLAMGFAWASIISIPYAILSGACPAGKMGLYAGIFNIFIVIPQIVASSVLAFIVHELFLGHTIYVMSLAGVFMALAALACIFIREG